MKSKEEPKQEAPRDIIAEQEDERIFKGLVAEAKKMEETQAINRKEPKQEEVKQEACSSCSEGCHCEKGMNREIDDRLMKDVTHLMAAGTDVQMLMKAMYEDNPGMYDIMKDMVQSGMGHALGQLLVGSVARRR